MNPSVSIIVPVYNVEKYLEDCLNSLINQTLKDIEIICIDDESSDKSLEILNAYAEKDSRIKVFSNNHSGIGSTRNFGLNHATGEYVLFVDSDDWLDMSACETLYENSKSNNLDVLLFLIKNYDESNNQFYTDDYYDNVILPSSFDNTVFNHEDIKEYLFSLAVVVYNKFIKRSLIEKFNIRFPTQVFFEDNPFHFEVLLGANKLSIVREHLLIRRRRDSSITADIDDKFLDVIKISNHVWNVFEKYNEFDNYLLKLSNYKVNYFRRWYNLIEEEFKSDYLKLMQDDFEELKNNQELYDKFFDNLNNSNKNFYENVLKSESYEELDNLNSQYHSEFESRKKFNKQKKQLNEKRKELKQLENELKLKNDELIALQNKIDLEKNELEDKIKSFKDIIEESEKDLQVRYDNFVRYVDVKNAYFEDKEKELEDRRLSFEEFMSQRESDFNRYVDVKNAYFDDKETELSVEYLKFKKGRIKMEKDLEDNRSRFEIDIAEREKELEDRRLSFEEHMSQRESDFESAVAEREKELSDERLRFNQDVADRDKELEDRRLSFEEHMSQRESDFNSYVDVKNAYFEGKEKELEDRRLSFEELMSQRESDFESAVAEKEKELEDERLRFNQDMAKREKELSDDRLSFEEYMSQKESDFEHHVDVKNVYFEKKEKELENERSKFNKDANKRENELFEKLWSFESDVSEKEKELEDNRLRFESVVAEKEKELEDNRLRFENEIIEKEKELQNNRLRFENIVAEKEKELSDERLTLEEDLSKREEEISNNMELLDLKERELEDIIHNRKFKFISKLVSKVPKISIIIPVYNVEEYLHQCLDSVVNQTLRDIEIICVDDGSTDDSLKILNEYEKRDFRFKVLTQKNRGPGAARNNALDVASGEYVMFLDSDDWLELDTCRILYEKSKLNDLDMVFFLLKNYSEERDEYYEDNYYNLVTLGDEFDDRVFSYKDLGNLVFNISVSPCQKIYRRDILKDIRFLENIYFEDNPFYWETMFSSKRIALIREHFYLRRRREDSITISYDYKYMDCIYISNQVVDVFKKYDMFEYFNERLAKYKVGYLKQWYEVLDKDVKYEFWRLMKDDFAKIKNDSKYQMFIEYLSPDLRKFFESTLSSRSPYELEYLQIYGDE